MGDEAILIGLQAIMEMEEFDSGSSHYMDSIQNMSDETDKVGSSMSAAMMGAAVAIGTAIGEIAVHAVESLIDTVKELITAAPTAAANVQELDYAMQVLANNAGISVAAAEAEVKAITELGITDTAAYDTMNKFIKSNLELADASALAKEAQDASVIAHTTASDALGRMTMAITRHSDRMLKLLGITVNFNDAYKAYAAAHNIAVSAMTEDEKTAAGLQAVLERGTKIAGAYAAALQTPALNWKQLNVDVEQLTETIGGPFNAANLNVVMTLRETAQAFKKAFDEGGPFRDLMIQAGAWAEYLTEVLRNTAKAAVNFLISLGTEEGRKKVVDFFSGLGIDIQGVMDNLANNAVSWGQNLIEMFAEGMVNGIVAVINVLADLGNVIASWLAPGSPPRILPNLDKWGTQAMQVYLNGWKQADFSVFEDLASTLSTALQSMPDIAKNAVIPATLEMRNALAGAVEGLRSGELSIADAVSIVAKSMGNAGDMVKGYVEALLSYSKAEDEVATAQKKLNAITAEYDVQLADLNNKLKAFKDQQTSANENARIAAIDQAIGTGLLTLAERKRLVEERTQLILSRQIRDTEAKKATAMSAAEAELKAAKDNLDLENAKMTVQKAMLNVQLETNKLLKQQLDMMNSANKGGGGGGGGGVPGAGGGGGGGGKNISDTLRDAVEKAKQTIATKMGELWAIITGNVAEKMKPITDAWDNVEAVWGPIIDKLKSRIKYLVDEGLSLKTLQTVIKSLVPKGDWDAVDKVFESIQGIITFLQEHWKTLLVVVGVIATVIALISVAVSLIGPLVSSIEWIVTLIVSIGGILSGLGLTFTGILPILMIIVAVLAAIALGILGLVDFSIKLYVAWTNNWFGIQQVVQTAISIVMGVWDGLVSTLQSGATWLTTVLLPLFQSIADLMNTVWALAITSLAGLWQNVLQPALSSVWDWLVKLVAHFGFVSDAVGTGSPVQNAINNFKDLIGDIIAGVLSDIIEKLGWVKLAWDAITSAIEGITKAIDGMTDKLENLTLPWWLTPHSPTPFEIGLRGISSALDTLTSRDLPRLKLEMGGLNTNLRGNSVTNIDNSRHISMNMNPSYQNVQSPASLYYDVTAALATMRI